MKVLGSALPESEAVHEIQELIGEGGMGSVWRVWDPRLARTVALKRVHMRRGAAADQRFVLEAQVTGRLQHPGIPPVYELGVDPEGRPYFTMRELSGQTLSAVACDLPLERKIQILVRVCDAVAYAHDQGVLHRDLKPSNILIGDYGEVMVLDWGIAKLMDGEEDPEPDPDVEVLLSSDPHLTQMGAVLGTVGFMSPEQACGDRAQLGPRSDVFSLGAVLFTLCTEEPLFANLRENQDGHFSLPEDIPAELRAVLLRALAPQPEQRIESVRALGEELQAWLDGRPVASMAYSAGALLGLWAKRHRRPLLLGTTLALMVGTLTSAGLAKYLRDVGQETRRAQDAEHLAEAALARSELARGQALLAAQQPHLARSSLRAAVTALLATDQDPTAAAMALWSAHAHSPAPVGTADWPETLAPFPIERYGEGQPKARMLRPGQPPLELGYAYDLWMNARYAVPASYYEAVWLWDLQAQTRVRQLCPSRCRAWGSPEGDLLAVYDEEAHRLRIETLESGAVLWTRDVPDAQALAWTEDALVLGGDLDTLIVLERTDGRERLRLGGHRAPVRELRLHEGALLSQDARGEVLRWSLPLRSTHAIHWEGELTDMTAGPRGVLLSGPDRVVLYEPQSMAPILDAPLPFKARNIAMRESQAWIHLEDGRVYTLDLDSGALTQIEGLDMKANAWLLTEQGLLVADSAKGLSLGWPGQEPAWTREEQALGVVWSVHQHKDSGWLSHWTQQAITQISLEDGRELARFELPAAPYGGDVAPQGAVAFGLADGQVALIHDGQLRLLQGAQGLVMDVAFSPDGAQLAAVSWDRSMRIWDVESQALLGELGFGGTVFSVQADGPGAWWVGQAGAQVWRVDLGGLLTAEGGPR